MLPILPILFKQPSFLELLAVLPCAKKWTDGVQLFISEMQHGAAAAYLSVAISIVYV